MKKVVLLCAFLSILSLSNGQIQKNGKAEAVINIGSVEYAIISMDNNNDLYKTSTFTNNLIVVGQSLILEYEDVDDLTPEVLLPSRNAIYAFPLSSNYSGDFTVPAENLPGLYKGMLVFDDYEHCASYYIDMREFIDDTLGEANEKLDAFEDYFDGYVSYRTYFNNKYDFDNIGYGSDEVLLIEKEDVLNDEVIKTLMNKNRMVVIGDSVYYQHDFDVYASCGSSDTAAINTLINIQDGVDLYVGDSAVYRYPGVKIIHPRVSESNPKDINQLDGVWKVESVLLVDNLTCDMYTRLVAVVIDYHDWDHVADSWTGGVNYWFEHPNTSVVLTIDWGDGTIEQINQYEGQWLSHEYTSAGQFTITTTTDVSYSGHGILNDSKPITVGGPLCSQQDNHTFGSKIVNDWMITTKLWLNDNFWGNHYGAYTHAWRFSGGAWKKKKTHLRTIVDGKLRNDNCQPTETVYGEKDRLNRKEVEKVKTKLFNHYDIANYDVKSVHLLWQGSIHMNYTIYLTPCN